MSSGFESAFRKILAGPKKPAASVRTREYQPRYRARKRAKKLAGGLDLETLEVFAAQYSKEPLSYVRAKHARRDAKSSAAMRKVR